MLPGSVALASADDVALEAHVPARYVAATTRDLIVFYWLGDADLQGVQLLHQLCDKQTARGTRPMSALHFIHERASLPNAAVRAGLATSMKHFAHVVTCFGVALLGTGFWASAMRSALTGVRLLAPVGAAQMRFAQSPEELVPWLLATHEKGGGEVIDANHLRAVVSQVRALGDHHPPA